MECCQPVQVTTNTSKSVMYLISLKDFLELEVQLDVTVILLDGKKQLRLSFKVSYSPHIRVLIFVDLFANSTEWFLFQRVSFV